MKRIKIFVLLCVVVFMMSGVAWATDGEETTTSGLSITCNNETKTNDGKTQIIATQASGDVTITGTVTTTVSDFIQVDSGANVTLDAEITTSYSGAAICVDGGTLNITGGKIEDSTLEKYALVFVGAGGTLNINGGG